jgi:glycosyltransferase involved in cell wall biosynthesis
LADAGSVRVYDVIDQWDSELGHGWYRAGAERRTAREADLLTASAPELARRLEGMTGRGAHLLPNAYNGRIFHQDAAGTLRRPVDLPEASRVALYVGALWGGWMDWALVERAARALPGTAFVFVGDHRDEGADLPANCHFPGLKPQAELPAYLAHADVAFLPWTVDEITRATSPLKIYEFVAMGLPVVAPDLEPLHGIPGVSRRAGVDDFVAGLGEVGRGDLTDGERREMAEFSAANSWKARVDALLARVADTTPGSGASPGPLGRLGRWLGWGG